jgi:ribosomal protein L4
MRSSASGAEAAAARASGRGGARLASIVAPSLAGGGTHHAHTAMQSSGWERSYEYLASY